MADEPATTGPNITQPTGAPLITVLHTERRMRVYGVTENELRTLTLVNVAVAALFSLGTGCFGYAINLETAMMLANPLPPQGTLLHDVVRPAVIGGGLFFYAVGIILWFVRGGFLNTIKTESGKLLGDK